MLKRQFGEAFGWLRGVRRRRGWLACLFVLWALWLAVQLAVAMTQERVGDPDGNALWAWRAGTVPALRGRILDANGRPLAWSWRRFVLLYDIPANPAVLQADRLFFRQHPELDAEPQLDAAAPGQERIRLRTDLDPEELARLGDQVRDHPRLRIVSSFLRCRADGGGALTAALGVARQVGQRQVGISGWEREYEDQLRGRDGRYRVMIDAQGDWIPETWEELALPTPGSDVYVDARLTQSAFP